MARMNISQRILSHWQQSWVATIVIITQNKRPLTNYLLPRMNHSDDDIEPNRAQRMPIELASILATVKLMSIYQTVSMEPNHAIRDPKLL